MIKAYLSCNCPSGEFIKRSLWEYVGEKREFIFKRHKTGKPYAQNGPFFSFSDSCGYMLCAVSDYDLGADLELRRDSQKYMKIAKRFFAPDEAAAATPESFFELYTAKEAYVKYTQMGIFSGLEKFSALSGRVGSVNIIKFSYGECVCAVASEKESEVEAEWIYL